ncbi:hypothetical protein EauS123_00006 [Exiguobacterium phage vB_EauS-123]|nr:hypothetical protein EauS123_00006 [Exiguobacterium phage vB_EauS-123]
MMDQAERIRQLEAENETLLTALEVVYDARKENEVLRQAIDNIETITKAMRRSWRDITVEIVTTRVKIQVLEESE